VSALFKDLFNLNIIISIDKCHNISINDIIYLVRDGDGIILLGLRISLGGVCCLLSRLLSTSTKCIDRKNVNDGDGNTNNFFSSLNIPTSVLSDVVICQPP